MKWWHRLWSRRKMEEDLEKELRFHLDHHTADLIAKGLDPEEARRRARLALGGPEQVKESAATPEGHGGWRTCCRTCDSARECC
jgi:putative ABC transport system permease protein